MSEPESGSASRRGCLAAVSAVVAALLLWVLVVFSPDLYGRFRAGESAADRWLAVATGAFAAFQLFFLATAYGYAAMASVRRLYWCAHRRKAVKRWRRIAWAAGIGPVRRWAALRAGTNAPTKQSIKRLWKARTPAWLGRGLFLLGFAATIGAWVDMGADLADPPIGIFGFVILALVVLGDDRTPSVFESTTLGKHALRLGHDPDYVPRHARTD
ncbi:putative protein OS=Tsukamurella paurometabola (strain ATCC 8368 / DSM / CCUG 35730 /CIP 100753 / JCM 10117 / KCTC 9821 / NBRC 16120 / NCIMB 702349/ NCTC 13040) OX=521096 GN=Tpau_2541 PE=4 SV=1 [Tsukamurella paurometabola]|uniref:Uncharacterized protein n=1 Tax=Tsukamurella paurometabola (strain ATCC 8368 / DSM 20162 / CCUG 35730 / CIP 100753 / JCM 10117 / KCTC 9821 / NBRC 16120 / NCIMB 702349 / NCTC 13040) TaxID=521096 RepID=D5URT9_TSUPD|nr:hypothetical protein [Tsukamurella paurometabola]ADG79144.1 hypothetical protein Tpau_2541 [Tsukamurella paurometabola DSM 20162]SUP34265.1 Uncharacterised protein [Tsukamurella paurometabola]